MYTVRGVRGMQNLGGTQFCDQLTCRSNGSINDTDRVGVLGVPCLREP
jgi:hypothetical protein